MKTQRILKTKKFNLSNNNNIYIKVTKFKKQEIKKINMVNFNDNFKESFSILKKHPFLIIPFAISQLIFFSFVFSTLHFSGFSQIMVELDDINKINAKNLNEEALNQIKLQQYELMNKLENLDFSKIYLITGIGFLAYILIGTFFANLGFLKNSQIIEKKEDSNLFDITKSNIFSLYLKFLGLRIVFVISYFLPVLLFIFTSAYYFSKNEIIGMTMIGFSLLFMLLWLIFVSSKFYFSEAIIYLKPKNFDNTKSLFNVVKASFKISQGKLFKILLIIIVIYGFTSIANTIASQPFYYILRVLSELGTALQNPIFYIIVFLLIVVQGLIMCFGNLLFLKSYYQFFKDLKNKTKNRL